MTKTSQQSSEGKGPRVAIIGAGPSGLAAVKQCLEEGLNPVCFERHTSLGGLWRSADQSPFHQSTSLHTSKEMMQFSDFPVPTEWPEFLPYDMVNEYLNMYGTHFGLLKYIKFGRRVYSVKPQMVDGAHSGKWEVIYRKKERKKSPATLQNDLDTSLSSLGTFADPTLPPTLPGTVRKDELDVDNVAARMTSIDIDRGVSIDGIPQDENSYRFQFSDGSGGEDAKSLNSASPTDILPRPQQKKKASYKRDVFDYVLVCTGHYWSPNMPKFPGSDSFNGPIIHSSQYKMPYPYKDERVVVVGVGNSGLDIASDIAPHASKVFLSSRSGTWVAPRTTVFGMPTDHLSTRAVHSIPKFLLNYALESLISFHHGDMERYNLKPKHRFLESNPVIGTSILQHIDTGRVIVKNNVKRFSENAVEFEDGSMEEIDVVIQATGFVISNPFIDDEIMGKENSNRVRLYKHVFPTKHSNLAFIGLVKPNGSLLPVAELQARWASRVFSGKAHLPSLGEMRDQADIDWQHHQKQYIDRPRTAIAVDQVEYMDLIADQIGVRPDLWRVFQQPSKWGLGLRLAFGPCISAQYRLYGPGKWDRAEDVIAIACAGVDIKKRLNEYLAHQSTENDHVAVEDRAAN